MLRRIVRALFSIYIVATVVFFLLRLLPGNPVEVYIGKLTSNGTPYREAAAQAASLYTFDPNEPLWKQYLDYLWGVAHLDFGKTLAHVSVMGNIGQHLPWTIFSVGGALVISVAVGLLLGMAMAYRRGGILDNLSSAIGSTLYAIPNYLLALLVVAIGSTQLGLFDIADVRGTHTDGVEIGFNATFFGDAVYHAALPMLIYFLTTVGTWALIMKASTVQTLEEDFVMVARARGLGGRRIGSMYVGRNAVLPLVAQIATQAGFVVGGAIFVEYIFNYDGIGGTLYAAINSRDYSLVQGILLIITIVVILANLLADLTYGLLDPRIRTAGKR
ncbi:MAG TPA: ABC transporter permease [Stackebrandtia sp.]|uniref:ABC transporter permease n=1 Tax=Stackebrandtia sp. TaxID=2023065 RepID=UPI002D257B08|nr:ABC transporter permease [Stackebrandtia sp.]HZE39279.1 ABC transporter permease [Stackebrandtia sp.]